MQTFRNRILIMGSKTLFVWLLLYLLTIRYLLFEYLGHYYSVTIISIKFLAFIIALDILNDLLKYFYRRRIGLKAGQHDNITLGLNNIYLLLVLGSSIVTITAYFGLNPRELFTSLSIVAAAIAIISRDYIVDIISGMFIAFSKEVVIDDYIKIGDHTGKIVDIGINKTALLNDDDDVVYLPNHKFIMNDIINYSRRTIRRTILELEVKLSHLQSLEDLEQAVNDLLKEFNQYIAAESFRLKVIHIYEEHLQLKIQYDLTVADRNIEKTIRKAVLRGLVNKIQSLHSKSHSLTVATAAVPVPPHPSRD